MTTFIDAGCGTGIIPNAVSHRLKMIHSVGVESDLGRYEMATNAVHQLMHEFVPSPFAEFIFGSITNFELMHPLLDRENIRVWFNNFGTNMLGEVQSGFEFVL
mmetsp:Transcript_21456/g.44255  ORF Transcript_21456/g.44255 Transcript_21456/m.44255 type:complete len:103 (+) Transcript_21456:360-668(+)